MHYPHSRPEPITKIIRELIVDSISLMLSHDVLFQHFVSFWIDMFNVAFTEIYLCHVGSAAPKELFVFALSSSSKTTNLQGWLFIADGASFPASIIMLMISLGTGLDP